MDFGLTDEQELLRETVRRFVIEVCPAETAKQWDDAAYYPVELFDGFARLGWTGLAFSEDLGGGGGGAAELAIITEELGRASLDVAQCFCLTLQAGLVLQDFAPDALRHRLVPAVMAGDARLSIAIS